MPVTLDSKTQARTCGQPSGTPLAAICERLTERGLNVRVPQEKDSRLIKASGTAGACCEILVADDQTVECEYFAPRDSRTDPDEIARIVVRILGAARTGPGEHEHPYRGLNLKGAIACEMKGHGLTVDMTVSEDHETYDVFAEVVITNPARPGCGEVRINDTGWVYWHCYADELPDGTTEVADTIADILTPRPATVRNRLRTCLQRLSMRHYRADTREPQT